MQKGAGNHSHNIPVSTWSICRGITEVLARALAYLFAGNSSGRYLPCTAADYGFYDGY